ncbi:MAG TPA: VOC family protein [Nocardioidaceae bacterium]|nr:VOC family protein [Nocardioidaceae bacterium]
MQHGSIIFVEIPVRDLARAADFYAGLLGWSFLPDREPDRWMFVPGGRGAMGAITTTRPSGVAGTHLAIAVEDVPATTELAIQLGGGVTAIEQRSLGYSAELIDPDGNHFWVFERKVSRREVASHPPVWHDTFND